MWVFEISFSRLIRIILGKMADLGPILRKKRGDAKRPHISSYLFFVLIGSNKPSLALLTNGDS